MFQSLLGILKSGVKQHIYHPLLLVSIPPRYSKILSYQSLVLPYVLVSIPPRYSKIYSGAYSLRSPSMFQSLLGILKSSPKANRGGSPWLFQSLLGILKSVRFSYLGSAL